MVYIHQCFLENYTCYDFHFCCTTIWHIDEHFELQFFIFMPFLVKHREANYGKWNSTFIKQADSAMIQNVLVNCKTQSFTLGRTYQWESWPEASRREKWQTCVLWWALVLLSHLLQRYQLWVGPSLLIRHYYCVTAYCDILVYCWK